MRYLFAIAIMLAAVLVFAKPAKASTKTSYFYLHGEKMELDNNLYGGETWTFEVKNTTDVSATFPFKVWYSMRNGNGGYSNESLKIVVKGQTYSPGVKESVYYTEPLTYNVSMAAGESTKITITYTNSGNANARTTQYLQMSVAATAALARDYTYGGSSINPTTLQLNQKYYIPPKATYYEFTLDKAAEVTVNSQSYKSYSYKCAGIDSNEIKNTTNIVKQFKLDAGTYQFHPENPDAGMEITITKEDFVWGTMDITVSGNTVSAVYTDAAGTSEADKAAAYIDYWRADTNSRESSTVSGKVKSFTGSFEYTIDYPGWYTVYVTVKNSNYGDYACKTYSQSFVKKPAAPTGLSIKTADRTSVTTASLGSYYNGNYISLQLYKGGKWYQTITKTYNSVRLTGLKPNTVYKLRIAGVVRKEGKPDVISGVSKSISFRTGTKTKPSIKSVKISKAKVVKHPYKPATEYWDSLGNYHRVAERPAYSTTSFNVTVVLKSRAKGPAGIMVNGKFKKGTGKKFTVRVTVTGNKLNKKTKLSICYANSQSYGGRSPAVTKYAKVRK